MPSPFCYFGYSTCFFIDKFIVEDRYSSDFRIVALLLRDFTTCSSDVSDFNGDVHIWSLAFYIVGIELFFATTFQYVTFAAQFTVVLTLPFIEDIVQALLSC